MSDRLEDIREWLHGPDAANQSRLYRDMHWMLAEIDRLQAERDAAKAALQSHECVTCLRCDQIEDELRSERDAAVAREAVLRDALIELRDYAGSHENLQAARGYPPSEYARQLGERLDAALTNPSPAAEELLAKAARVDEAEAEMVGGRERDRALRALMERCEQLEERAERYRAAKSVTTASYTGGISGRYIDSSEPAPNTMPTATVISRENRPPLALEPDAPALPAAPEEEPS